MRKKLAAENIDFADSEYKYFDISEDRNLTIYLNSWNNKKLRIVFNHVIRFFYSLGSGPKDLYEVLENDAFLNEALATMYIKIPKSHSYKLFHMEDIDDLPFIQVVAESVAVFKE